MAREAVTAHNRLTTPRAAALAGIAFSILFIISLVLIRVTVPGDPQDPAPGSRATATPLVSRCICCRSPASPFCGSSACCATASASVKTGSSPPCSSTAGVIMGYRVGSERLVESGLYSFGRAVVYHLVNIYALKMAGCS